MADKETVIAAMKCIVNLETVAVADCKKKGCVYAGKECMGEVIKDALKLLDPTPPKEYILRSDAIKAICGENCWEKGICGGICEDTDRIRDIPAADVEPIVYGEWEERVVEEADVWSKRRFYCSACGDWQTYGKTPRCCYCGAHLTLPTAKAGGFPVR